jgi:hypothetical protein
MKGCPVLARAVGFVAIPQLYCAGSLGTPANLADAIITTTDILQYTVALKEEK